jgi:hypothetical protein
MRSEFTENHFSDADGNPAGGTTFGQGFAIGWQNGPLNRGEKRLEPNGAFVEDIIAVAIGRIEFYQSSKFACWHNAEAMKHLIKAGEVLNARTADREKREVEGTHAV